MVCRPTPNGAAPVVKLESFVIARICLQIRGNPSPASSLRGFACKSAAIQFLTYPLQVWSASRRKNRSNLLTS